MTRIEPLRRPVQIAVLLSALILAATAARAATLPTGFQEALVASGLANPTAMQFSPDGRLFVCQQGGQLRVIKDGVLLSTPFLTVPVSSAGERGLLGVAFDPAFETNQYVYVYYTATSPAVHNRISRFTASGDVAVAGSEVVILELDNLSSATNHNGGALAFGPDGKLYAAVGENANGANAQSFANLLGKVLRINSDGSIPTDNPFYATASGRNRAIWALGLRNPFTFAFDAAGTDMFINDVGQVTWEEIDAGLAGANYGWPETEGTTTDPRFVSPRHVYGHTGGACAITGGTFYSPLVSQFPSDYSRDYFFADYCAGWIRVLDRATNTASAFASGIAAPVDLKVSSDGALYYLARGSGSTSGAVYRVTYGNSAPTITSQPASRTVAAGATATFSVGASGAAPLRYQWQRNGAAIAGATGPSYTLTATAADSGARFRVVVTNDFGSVTSSEAVLTVSSNQAPTAAITQPAAGATYTGGAVIAYAGSGTDPEDGTLPDSAFTWQVDFHHDTHVHPFIAPTSGSQSGSFTVPRTGETSANVWYRIILTVRDAAGLTHTISRDVVPVRVRLTLATSPAGLQLRLDSQPVATPHAFDSVVGVIRTIEAVTPQASGGTSYTFVSWSDGGAVRHDVTTPPAAATYTATFQSAGAAGSGTGLAGTYFHNANLTGVALTRVDPTVDYAWGTGSPAPSIGADTFSVRWTGQVEAQFTETYRFYTQSDDGVRLWVNGRRLVNNWTNHASREDSGTIALVAGQRYDIRLEYYENAGSATARLSWSSPSTPKAVVPSTRLYPATTRVNFQPASAPVPAGYLADGGLAYGARGNGQTYGWNANTSAETRDRNAAASPDQRYDTLIYMQRPTNPDAVWEIALPNATYAVRVVAGDPVYVASTYRLRAEGVLAVSGTATTAARWLEGTVLVTVSDGRLTLRGDADAVHNQVCFIDIARQ